jgi:hypothetical protein
MPYFDLLAMGVLPTKEHPSIYQQLKNTKLKIQPPTHQQFKRLNICTIKDFRTFSC